MAFQDTWNATYETLPADTEQESLGAGRIRDLKVNIRERIQQDHLLNGNADDGYHQQTTLHVSASDPAGYTFAGDGSGASFLYTKATSGINELFWKDSSGNVTQLTSGGALDIPPQAYVGEMRVTAAASAPSKWYLCYGQAVSRTTYAALFAVIGTTFGAGDGSTTFNLPDMRGCVAAGVDNMGGTAANRITSGNSGISGTTLGASGGNEQLHGHAHTTTESPHIHQHELGTSAGAGSGGLVYPSSVDAGTQGNTKGATTGLTINSTGGGNSQNVQPTMMLNWMIFANA